MIEANPNIQAPGSELARNWLVILGCFIGMAAGVSALPYYTQGLFVPALTETFGWTREQLSTITLVGGIVLALCSPLVGWLVDRVNPRLPLILSFAAMAGMYLAISHVDGRFGVFFVLQAAMFALGALTGPVLFTRIINQYFEKSRGTALGITLTGSGAMALVGPPLLAATITDHGWRAGYVLVATLIAGLGIVAVAILWRFSAVAPAKAPTTIKPAPEPLARPVLLGAHMLIAMTLLALGIGGFTFHMVPLLTDAGLSLERAASVQGTLGVSVLIGRLASGILVDRIFAPYVAAAIMLLAAAGILGLDLAGPDFAMVCALLIGFALGMEGDVIGYLTARYYGIALYGRLYGLFYGFFALALGLSPVLVSRLHTVAQSYQTSLWLSAMLLFVGSCLLVLLPRFKDDHAR